MNWNIKVGSPTAVISFSDAQTVGAVHAAKKHGLKVPEEISFVGFNNTELAEFLTRRLQRWTCIK